MRRFARVQGVLVEPVGHLWVGFSPATGETALLNDEAAAVLEVLECGAAGSATIAQLLSADSGVDASTIAEVVEGCWPRLIEAGLVRELPAAQALAQ
jgi:hypothetical protein